MKAKVDIARFSVVHVLHHESRVFEKQIPEIIGNGLFPVKLIGHDAKHVKVGTI
jgi:hypothetical protein